MGLFGDKNPAAYSKKVPQWVKDKIASGELSSAKSIKVALAKGPGPGAPSLSPILPAPNLSIPSNETPIVLDAGRDAFDSTLAMKRTLVAAKTPAASGAGFTSSTPSFSALSAVGGGDSPELGAESSSTGIPPLALVAAGIVVLLLLNR